MLEIDRSPKDRDFGQVKLTIAEDGLGLYIQAAAVTGFGVEIIAQPGEQYQH